MFNTGPTSSWAVVDESTTFELGLARAVGVRSLLPHLSLVSTARLPENRRSSRLTQRCLHPLDGLTLQLPVP